jgi:hypothetical protein
VTSTTTLEVAGRSLLVRAHPDLVGGPSENSRPLIAVSELDCSVCGRATIKDNKDHWPPPQRSMPTQEMLACLPSTRYAKLTFTQVTALSMRSPQRK